MQLSMYALTAGSGIMVCSGRSAGDLFEDLQPPLMLLQCVLPITVLCSQLRAAMPHELASSIATAQTLHLPHKRLTCLIS